MKPMIHKLSALMLLLPMMCGRAASLENHLLDTDNVPVSGTLQKVNYTADLSASPFGVRQTYKKVKPSILSRVPEALTKSELMAAFKLIRDDHYLTDPKHPGLRTISWHFIGDGCETRAVLAVDLVKEKLHLNLEKIYVFGLPGYEPGLYGQPPLAAATPIALDGIVNWAYHVAAIAQFNHQIYVLDPALDPNAPIPLEAWFKALSPIKRGMTGMPPTTPEEEKRILELVKVPNFNIAICDQNAWGPFDTLCQGGAPIDQRQLLSTEARYLTEEWNQYKAINRNPNLEFLQS